MIYELDLDYIRKNRRFTEQHFCAVVNMSNYGRILHLNECILSQQDKKSKQ